MGFRKDITRQEMGCYECQRRIIMGWDTSPVIMKREGKQKSVEKDDCLASKVKGMMMS